MTTVAEKCSIEFSDVGKNPIENGGLFPHVMLVFQGVVRYISKNSKHMVAFRGHIASAWARSTRKPESLGWFHQGDSFNTV